MFFWFRNQLWKFVCCMFSNMFGGHILPLGCFPDLFVLFGWIAWAFARHISVYRVSNMVFSSWVNGFVHICWVLNFGILYGFFLIHIFLWKWARNPPLNFQRVWHWFYLPIHMEREYARNACQNSLKFCFIAPGGACHAGKIGLQTFQVRPHAPMLRYR